MLKLTMKRGDAVHMVFHDGTDCFLEARSRCEIWVHMSESIKITREKAFRQPEPNLINRNQK